MYCLTHRRLAQAFCKLNSTFCDTQVAKLLQRQKAVTMTRNDSGDESNDISGDCQNDVSVIKVELKNAARVYIPGN